MSRLLLKLGCVLNILEFCLCFAIFFTTKSAQNVACLVFSPSLDKPSGRLGKVPDDAEEKDEWDNLERNRKPPSELRCSIVNVRAATLLTLVYVIMHELRGTYYSSQYATTTPKTFNVNSIAMN